MNRLPLQKRKQALNMLVEGSSMRSVSRVLGISFNSVTRLLVTAGIACAAYHDEVVRDLTCRRIQCDELWAFCYAKEKSAEHITSPYGHVGDVWTWTGLDADSKLLVSWLVGGRDSGYALEFMDDLRSRLVHRVQLTTDGHWAYLDAVDGAFGGDVDYAQLVKVYGQNPDDPDGRRYSPPECVAARKVRVSGSPDLDHISTSLVERHNLSIRMGVRRFTRLTNAFSKKVENHSHAMALYAVYYNFVRTHRSLSEPYAKTPAMAAGLTTQLRDMDWLVAMIDEKTPKPRLRGPYKATPRI